jgi:hypothetical protein
MSTSEQADSETNATQRFDSQQGELPDEISQETGRGEETAELPLDRVFEILKNQRRREVLRHLREQSGQIDLGDLAEHVAAVENDTTTQALTADERKRVYVGLYQCHLPKMDDIGIVEFNQDRGYVELGETASQLDPYLDTRDAEESLPWHRYYGAVALLGIAAVVAATTLSLGATGSLLLFGSVVTLFASFSCWQWFVESGGELSI